MNSSTVPTTRLAPSPTGALHLGNARTFLINWALARQQGWRIVLRIEDLDGPRIKSGADQQAIEDLRWLGLHWDGEPLFQRADLTPYQEALESLRQRNLIYPCRCTRAEIERAQSAPHADEHELRYPGTCRPGPGGEFQVSSFRFQVEGKQAEGDIASACHVSDPKLAEPAWRLIVPDEPITFHDEIQGPQSFNVQEQVGDFLVATKAGLPAYQLAVVVDDARQGVTEVVRGDDLLRSTARQILLYRLLDLTPLLPRTPLPRYWHLPLVLGPDGRRLAKRHGDTRLSWYRRQGVAAQRVIGLLAYWCGCNPARRPMTAARFVEQFNSAALSRQPVTFTNEDSQWLVQG